MDFLEKSGKSVLFCPCLAPFFIVMVLLEDKIMNNNENVTIKIKTSINDLDLFDLPMVGLFK